MASGPAYDPFVRVRPWNGEQRRASFVRACEACREAWSHSAFAQAVLTAWLADADKLHGSTRWFRITTDYMVGDARGHDVSIRIGEEHADEGFVLRPLADGTWFLRDHERDGAMDGFLYHFAGPLTAAEVVRLLRGAAQTPDACGTMWDT